MNVRFTNLPDMLSIAAVERDTGIAKDTLRVWERRYDFPKPLRDANDDRAYPIDQVEKLRLLKRLLDQGHRPGRVVPLPIEGLRQLNIKPAVDTEAIHAHSPVISQEEMSRYLDLLRSHQTEALRLALSTTMMKIGLDRFVIELVAPLIKNIGEYWADGKIEIHEEHLFTEQIKHLLRTAINSVPRGHTGQNEDLARPRILLTTFPQEQHSLGLLMAEALMALEGCVCVSLGTQTPILEIAQAARAQKADIVALSFSSQINQNQVVDGLKELQSKLAPGVEVWAGGDNQALKKRPPEHVKILTALQDISESIKHWRTQQKNQELS
ncbi:cobalamin B12-binding domain-containing protein [Polynucleobacter sp. 30F-ANTBAC]|uniref:MerR family transcriptional regulator n=1 Tax=Polynucleobacter sp. 30F-ANTBAC TaxID=2689095 RepID=UPI001C0D4FBC|nr:cobalamin B12-binding domain-containing protein [Polynucleobacter sp. 30F-ANTBAC]MBU3600133.1 cobalamin B12-binding domain-containing protein [Polynucleobacter sp. 30F-ANTBAC]